MLIAETVSPDNAIPENNELVEKKEIMKPFVLMQ